MDGGDGGERGYLARSMYGGGSEGAGKLVHKGFYRPPDPLQARANEFAVPTPDTPELE
jgi:hypothetical protein